MEIKAIFINSSENYIKRENCIFLHLVAFGSLIQFTITELKEIITYLTLNDLKFSDASSGNMSATYGKNTIVTLR